MTLASGWALASVIPKKYEVETIIETRPNHDGSIIGDLLGHQLEVLKSRESLVAVAEDLELPAKWKLSRDSVVSRLSEIVEITKIRGTDLISIRLRHTDKWESVAITNALVLKYRQNSPWKVSIHQDASEPMAPISPNVGSVTLAGGFVGAILSPLFALILITVLRRRFPEVVKDGSTNRTSLHPAPEPANGMMGEAKVDSFAIASLVLGICSLALGMLTSLPAIIFGHSSRGRIRRIPGLSGTGFATTGMILGYVFLIAHGTLFALVIGSYLKLKATGDLRSLSGKPFSAPRATIVEEPDFPFSPSGMNHPLLMTEFGEFKSEQTPWSIHVSAQDRKLKISRQPVNGLGTAISPDKWRALEGWFAFIEDENHAWAYDGNEKLMLVEVTPEKNTIYETETIPRRVPDAIISRISPATRDKIGISRKPAAESADHSRYTSGESSFSDHSTEPKLIHLAANGILTMNGMEISRQALENALEKINRNSPNARVAIQADANVPYPKVVELINLFTTLGISNLSFSTIRGGDTMMDVEQTSRKQEAASEKAPPDDSVTEDVANKYLDLITEMARAKRSGIGIRHPSWTLGEKELTRFKVRYPTLPDAICIKLASQRLQDLEENKQVYLDAGIGAKHPIMGELQAVIDVLADLSQRE